MKKIELLAPAGGLLKLKYAIDYGADAVYVGGESFSLRTAAENFSDEELKEGISYAHERGKKLYVAANIIPHDYDMDEYRDYISRIADFGADGAIIADLGAFCVAKETAPDLEIHISTQANPLNSRAIRAWGEMSAKRVVLARELSIDEIKNIRKNIPADLELEMFVHGAMCVSYSGRCLLSNYMIGRDSNRGDCAQPCRWKYSLVEEKRPGQYFPVYENENGTFIFNSKDLNLIRRVGEIIESGVSSLKIEGRVKSEFYVASIVRAYREAIDDYYEGKPFNEALYAETEKVSHRDYWEGFYHGKTEKDGQIHKDASYIRDYAIVAVVTDYDEITHIATLAQRNNFKRGDTIEIIQPGVRGFISQTVDFLQDGDDRDIDCAPHAEMTLKMRVDEKVVKNSFVRKKR